MVSRRAVLCGWFALVWWFAGVSGGQEVVMSWENDQLYPRVAYNATCEQFLTVWEDHHWGGGGGLAVYGRWLRGDGTLMGPAFLISDGGTSKPDVAGGGATGRYLVVWEYEYSSFDHDIYAQFLNSDGTRYGESFGIAWSGMSESNPVVCHNSDTGEFLVVYERDNSGDPEFPSRDIVARPVSGEGVLGAEIAVTAEATLDQTAPAVAYSGGMQRYVVIWQELTSPSVLPYRIRGRYVDAFGGLDGVFHVSGTSDDSRENPSVAAGLDYGFLVVWESWNSGDNRMQIMGRLMGYSGWEFPVSGNWPGGYCNPSVDRSAVDGGFLVAYDVIYDEYDHDISVRHVDASGLVAGYEDVVTSGIEPERHAAVAFGGGTGALVVWGRRSDWFSARVSCA